MVAFLFLNLERQDHKKRQTYVLIPVFVGCAGEVEGKSDEYHGFPCLVNHEAFSIAYHEPQRAFLSVNVSSMMLQCSFLTELAYSTHRVRDKITAIFTDIFPQWSDYQWGSTGSDNGLAPNRRQASIWTNNGLLYWRIHVSLNELIKSDFCGLFVCFNSVMASQLTGSSTICSTAC